MNYLVEIVKRDIRFMRPAKTSRNTFTERTIRYILVRDQRGHTGIGECAPLAGLSIDDVTDYDHVLKTICEQINEDTDWRELDTDRFPSIRFGLEVAFADLHFGGKHQITENKFFSGQPIPINGLIWMDDIDAMRRSVDQKVHEGFDVIKMKVGAHNFEAECRLLEDIRKQYPPGKISLRVDANGAFDADDALLALKDLNRFGIHSVEQPIMAGQWDAMARVCRDSQIPVALDEELIGQDVFRNGQHLLSELKPAYLIIKPNLIGGLGAADEWVRLAKLKDTGWWATSALETNIGLNAIAQWVSKYSPGIPQGLGTGGLYENNIRSPLYVQGGKLHYDQDGVWEKISPERDEPDGTY